MILGMTHTKKCKLRLEHFVILESKELSMKRLGFIEKTQELTRNSPNVQNWNNLSSKNIRIMLNCNIKKKIYSYVQTNINK